MKVYELDVLAKPRKGNFPHYAVLNSKKKDEDRLRLDDFSGKPYPRKWKPIELYFAQPNFPRADFSAFPDVFVCNERAVDLAGEPLEMSGELLPVTIEGEKGKFFIHNITKCLNVLDEKRTTWNYLGPNKEFRFVDKPAFHPERFGEESLFKIPQDGTTRMYCLERTGDPDEGEFKAVVEKHKLTGLGFNLVWCDD